MSLQHEWSAFAAQVNKYLDGLDPMHQPMEKTWFKQVFGVACNRVYGHDHFNVGGDRVLRCTACGRTKVEEE